MLVGVTTSGLTIVVGITVDVSVEQTTVISSGSDVFNRLFMSVMFTWQTINKDNLHCCDVGRLLHVLSLRHSRPQFSCFTVYYQVIVRHFVQYSAQHLKTKQPMGTAGQLAARNL